MMSLVSVGIGMLIGIQFKLSGVSLVFKKCHTFCKESFCIFVYPFGYRAYYTRTIKTLVKKAKGFLVRSYLCF
ncbi:hypothetical protein BscR1v2_013630 [Bartonella schoenbuchensis R1]|uniref:Uncharacterized protein n=2 Tax=Bartonella schoenbuchensis TaxID=165694 RepID=A0A1S6XRE6_BARSR|nr:hypothetical protein BscR1v2_011750 [Bartonella schoenbuchensis R1]AQX31277.1 hypothetical protein BscR1v2_013630 [Bartonella schoenbuchensis R1]CDP80285.1 hypothetical protein BN1046_01212 [Bartonella schoenbuchensis]CDP80505.1 hypothetical protein BN1046_01441 [Bartonella schoenbuchensis]CDP80588.1 hypothetical protein BN1046_01531 [Bartonella schoenbuchensis]